MLFAGMCPPPVHGSHRHPSRARGGIASRVGGRGVRGRHCRGAGRRQHACVPRVLVHGVVAPGGAVVSAEIGFIVRNARFRFKTNKRAQPRNAMPRHATPRVQGGRAQAGRCSASRRRRARTGRLGTHPPTCGTLL